MKRKKSKEKKTKEKPGVINPIKVPFHDQPPYVSY
jgi:hypothetical protein